MNPSLRFRTKALFAHAWDLEDPGPEPLMSWMKDAGLDTLCLAATYHSGWFVHPHHRTRRLYWSESGACYFHPRSHLYAGTRLRPPVAALARQQDWLALAAGEAARFGLRLVCWTVGAHNTRLALAHPELAQHNVYGDLLPHALSLGHPEVRHYLKAVCRDIAGHFGPDGLQLESFGWLTSRHGHHHERDLTALNSFERELLSLCFNPETVASAEAAGLDIEPVRMAVRHTLEQAFRMAPSRPADHPNSMEELEQRVPELAAYNRFLQGLGDSLIAEIRSQSLAGTPSQLYLQCGFRPELEPVCDGFAVWVYGMTPEETFVAVQAGRRKFPPSATADLHCYVRLGMGVPASCAQLREILSAAREGGATGVYLYNYSESPPSMLSWIKDALEGF
jgi:hypothetical protein